MYIWTARPSHRREGCGFGACEGLAVRIINQCFSRCDTHLYGPSPTYVSAFCTDVAPCLLGMTQLRRRSVAGTCSPADFEVTQILNDLI